MLAVGGLLWMDCLKIQKEGEGTRRSLLGGARRVFSRNLGAVIRALVLVLPIYLLLGLLDVEICLFSKWKGTDSPLVVAGVIHELRTFTSLLEIYHEGFGVWPTSFHPPNSSART